MRPQHISQDDHELAQSSCTIARLSLCTLHTHAPQSCGPSPRYAGSRWPVPRFSNIRCTIRCSMNTKPQQCRAVHCTDSGPQHLTCRQHPLSSRHGIVRIQVRVHDGGISVSILDHDSCQNAIVSMSMEPRVVQSGAVNTIPALVLPKMACCPYLSGP
jgi:hypothetical protein